MPRSLHPALPSSMELPALRLVLRVADLGSVAAAAREQDLLPATATAAVRRLEAQLGVKLFTRNSRALKPTPEGEQFLGKARDAIALLDQGVQALREPLTQVRGLLRLSVSVDLGTQVLPPMLDDFLRLHPQLELELLVSDRMADLHREPVDAAIRYGVARQPSQIVRRLSDNHALLVASPDYLQRRGTPATPEDLQHHDALGLRLASRSGRTWRLLHKGQPVELRPPMRLVSDNGLMTRLWALAGHGIALKSHVDVADDLRAGTLVQVLPELVSEPYPLSLALAPGTHLTARMRALGTFLQQRFAAR